MIYNGFKAHLLTKNVANSTRATLLSDAKGIENTYGNLDDAFDQDKCYLIWFQIKNVSEEESTMRAVMNKGFLDIAKSRSAYLCALNEYRTFRERGMMLAISA
jgi:CRISPR/Cas system CMR-associated protein Cmr5 small subunit